jgi:hypothetical protein
MRPPASKCLIVRSPKIVGRFPLVCVTSGIFDELLIKRKFLADVESGNLSSSSGVDRTETRS